MTIMNHYGGNTDINFSEFENRISQKSKAELEALLNDDEQLKKFIDDSEFIRLKRAEKESLMLSNKSIAEKNLSQQSLIEERKNKLVEANNKLGELINEYVGYRTKIDSLSDNYAPGTVLALLQASTAEAEDASEKICEDFLYNKTMDVDKFLEKFTDSKKVANDRRIKADKLQEMITTGRFPGKQHSNSTNNSAIDTRQPVISAAYNQSNHSAPPAPYQSPYGAPVNHSPPGPYGGGYNLPYPQTSTSIMPPMPTSNHSGFGYYNKY